MPKFIALQDFDFSPNGVRVDKYVGDQVIDTEDANLIEVAVHNGWMREQLAKDEKGGTKNVAHAPLDHEAMDHAPAVLDDEPVKPTPRTKKASEDKAVKNAPENK